MKFTYKNVSEGTFFSTPKNSLNICGRQTVNVSCVLHDGIEKKRLNVWVKSNSDKKKKKKNLCVCAFL